MAEKFDAAEIESLLRRLHETGPEAKVDMLLEQLDPGEARLLRLCAIPHLFDSHLLRQMAPELDAEEATERFRAITLLPVVTICAGGAALHESARRHLFRGWFAPHHLHEFAEVSKRLYENFGPAHTETAQEGHDAEFRRMFHHIGFQREEGFAEFERLFAEKRGRFEHSKCDRLVRLVREYEEVLEPAYGNRLDRGDLLAAVEIFSRLLSDKELDFPLRLKCYTMLGAAYSAEKNWKAAAATYQDALRLVGKGSETGTTLMGYVQSLLRWSDEGRESEYRVDPAHQQGVAASIVPRIYNGLGVALGEMDRPDEAELLLKMGIRSAKAAEEELTQAVLLNNLGTLYRKMGEYEMAIKTYEQCVPLLRKHNDELRVAQVYNNLAIAYSGKNEWKRSKRLYNQSLSIKQKFGDLVGEARTLNNLTRVYRNIGDYDHAIQSARMAVNKFQSVHDFREMAKAQWNLGKLCLETGRRDESLLAYQGAIANLERAGEPYEAVRSQIRDEMLNNFS